MRLSLLINKFFEGDVDSGLTDANNLGEVLGMGTCIWKAYGFVLNGCHAMHSRNQNALNSVTKQNILS